MTRTGKVSTLTKLHTYNLMQRSHKRRVQHDVRVEEERVRGCAFDDELGEGGGDVWGEMK